MVSETLSAIHTDFVSWSVRLFQCETLSVIQLLRLFQLVSETLSVIQSLILFQLVSETLLVIHSDFGSWSVTLCQLLPTDKVIVTE